MHTMKRAKMIKNKHYMGTMFRALWVTYIEQKQFMGTILKATRYWLQARLSVCTPPPPPAKLSEAGQ